MKTYLDDLECEALADWLTAKVRWLRTASANKLSIEVSGLAQDLNLVSVVLAGKSHLSLQDVLD